MTACVERWPGARRCSGMNLSAIPMPDFPIKDDVEGIPWGVSAEGFGGLR